MKLTDQQKIDIVSQYLAGQSSVQIGKLFGVTHVAILKMLKVRGVEIRKAKGK
jgi:hypothetical protein